jgi:hypothetical protein
MLLACVSVVASFELPDAYLMGIWLFIGAALSIIAMDLIFDIRLPPAILFRQMDASGTREGFVAAAFAWLVLAFCLIDVTLFPIPLIVDPSSYATFEGGREHIRHISDMSWILPPIALICFRNRALRGLLICIGFIFPILVLDRNRLMAAAFSLILVIVLRRDNAGPFPWKTVISSGSIAAAAFSLLGTLRSGPLDYLPLPFSSFFKESPQFLKWLLLYTGAGIYNFSAIFAKDYRNPEFLLNQIIPFRGSVVTLGTDIPLDASTVNVGTEFFPFLMAFGWAGALFSILALYFMLLWSVKLLNGHLSIFTLLIFLRVSYVCVMSPFGPQAFTWTNFGFLFLCMVLPIFAVLLPNRLRDHDEQRS